MFQLERGKKQIDAEVNEARAQLDDLTAQGNDLSAAKKKLDGDVLLIKVHKTATINCCQRGHLVQIPLLFV